MYSEIDIHLKKDTNRTYGESGDQNIENVVMWDQNPQMEILLGTRPVRDIPCLICAYLALLKKEQTIKLLSWINAYLDVSDITSHCCDCIKVKSDNRPHAMCLAQYYCHIFSHRGHRFGHRVTHRNLPSLPPVPVLLLSSSHLNHQQGGMSRKPRESPRGCREIASLRNIWCC